MSNSNVHWSPADTAQPTFATAEIKCSDAVAAIEQARERVRSARETILRAENGQPTEPAARREAERVLREIIPTLNTLASAHGAARQNLVRAQHRWSMLLPHQQRPDVTLPRVVSVA